MKKTFTKADGTTETIEGTPEEISEYEKRLKEGDIKEQKRPQKKLLTEDQVRKMIEEAFGSRPYIVINPVSPPAPVLPSTPFSPWGPNIRGPMPWDNPFTYTCDSINVKDDGHLEQLQLEVPRYDPPVSPTETISAGGNVLTLQVYGDSDGED